MKQFKAASACAMLMLAAGLGGCGHGDPVSGTTTGGTTGGSTDGDSIFLNAMPPGSNGNSAGGVGAPQQEPQVPPANFNDQLQLYGNLAYAQPNLKAAPCTPPKNLDEHVEKSDLACNYYKHEGLEPDVVVSTLELTTPDGKSVTIKRDGWGVPFVEGEDRDAAQFGFGYASAQDRLWLHDLLRQIGRGRFSEYLGGFADTYAFDADLAVVAGYSEDELTAMVTNARSKFGPLGDRIIRDVDMMVAGINAYIEDVANTSAVPPEYATLAVQVPPVSGSRFPPAPWTRNDIVASAILIQSIFAVGGGGEHQNLRLLQHLDASIGPGTTSLPQAACELWRDLRHADAPETPRTITQIFTTQSPPSVSEDCPQALPAGVAIWDADSLQTREVFRVGGAALPIDLPLPGGVPLALPALRSSPVKAGVQFLVQALGARPRAHDDGVSIPQRRPAPRVFRASIDPFEGARLAFARAGFPMPRRMSNFIGVTANQTQDGHPIAVMGPQASYFLPQLLWEVAVKSNGGTDLDFAGRGVVFGDLPYINIGRGVDYAFSATSGSSDLIDIRVSRLCNQDGSPASREDGDGDGFPDADGYLFDDGDGEQCRRLYRRVDEWTAVPTVASGASGGSATPEQVERYILRTHYGPVLATATVGGAPVAISIQRSTFFGELETAPPFALATTRTVKNAQSFQQLFNSVTGTFNWLYVDKSDIGYIHSGLFPVRSPQAHPELPVWGDGRFEWAAMQSLPAGFFDTYGGDTAYPNLSTPIAQGDSLKGYFEWQNYLPLSAHPQVVNPPSGLIHSWNNAPANGWWAADANGSYGPIHRDDMLLKRQQAFQASGRKHDIATMAEIAADAAFTDLRAQEVLPELLALMRAGTLSADQQAVADLLQAWLDDGSQAWIGNGGPDGLALGGYRRDRDHDEVYDHRAAVVLMDAWYPELHQTIIPQVQALADAGIPVLQGEYDAPRQQGSAFQYGWFQMHKRVLQMALNRPGHTDYRALRCAGSGTMEACRAAVLAALDAALTTLGGVANQANWDGSQLPNHAGKDGAVVEDYDAVEHTAISFYKVAPIHWTNRPTVQQVVQVKRSRND